jgi:WD40 repeat protein
LFYLPDGKKVFTGGKTGNRPLVGYRDGEIDQTFTGHRDMIISADFSPDGKYPRNLSGNQALYLTTQGETSPKLWNVETGEFYSGL